VLGIILAAALLPAADARLPHPPIFIGGDEGFLLPSSGVVGGTGTAEDPFVIAGWDIQVDGPLNPRLTSTGINVHGTTAHFVIRDVVVWQAVFLNHGGITLDEVRNARVEAVWVNNTNSGIRVSGSNGVSIDPLWIQGPGLIPGDQPRSFIGTTGIVIQESSEISIGNSTVLQHYQGAFISDSRDVRVTSSSLVGVNRTGSGLHISRHPEGGSIGPFLVKDTEIRQWDLGLGTLFADRGVVRMEGSEVVDNDVGVDVDGSLGRAELIGNRIADNERAGVEGAGSPGLVMAGNEFTGNGVWAIRLGDGTGGRIEGNTFMGNGQAEHAAVVTTYRNPGMAIVNNTIQDNTGAGIEVGHDSHGTRVERNVIRGNGIPGPDPRGSDGWGINVMANDNLVRFNHVNGNAGPGIMMWGVRNNTIVDNDLSGNGGPDILWQRQSQDQNNVGPNDGVPKIVEGTQGTGGAQPASAPAALLVCVGLGLAARRAQRARGR
jgi:parallel beta-helix repeat protein